MRQASERVQFPMKRNWPGSEAHLPLFTSKEELLLFPTLGDGYVEILKRPHIGRRLVEVLSLLAQEIEVPAVFFCAAGKDRTGLVAAAILSSIGVPDETVMDDYARSADSLGALYTAWAREPNSTIEQTLQTYPHVMWSPREAMATLLAKVSQDYGSMRRYLKAQGAHASLFEALELRLLA